MPNPTFRIAHIDTERSWRGGENQVFSLIKGLSDRGHSNLAVVRSGSPLARRLSDLNCKLISVSPMGGWDIWVAQRLRRAFKKEQVDIIHAHTGHAVSLAALATVGTSRPFVLTRRVDFPVGMNILSRWKYGRAQRLISISNRVSEVLRGSGIPSEKIVHIPSGVDFKRFENVARVNFSHWGLSPDSIVIGQVAALAPHKDQATFLRAVAMVIRRFPRVHAVLVGDGELRTELEDLAASLAIASHTHFLGFRENPLDYLAAFDIFCFSSTQEGLGTSIMDAMGLRVPVVATRSGGIPDLVEDGVSGCLVAPQNPMEMAHVLESLMGDPERRKNLVQAAFQKVQQFDISVTVSKTEDVYRDVLSASA